MLDNATKKNIDDCRDVLVGKVPDPKSQIEQITLALIYKFMDDMDKEAVEKFKGKPKFFTGEYSKYGWRKLFDPALSGADMLALYSDALDKLNTNPNIPELFRNIFKNAYLPYRDPATLKLFLKHINAFEYSHSEKLGDAFEYLLSVMGSQGDAGQFRTPRHIIDFVTACVDPQKGETVLDPACGTAGFLLSAYKHILNQNTDKRQGDKLKPEERKKLSENIVGYDISPDMVRLSLANMYLHGFSTPEIHEYDTLSSEDRWNETYDVILANPPFMTPKGGIRPHKKFGVQANKAELLFTDYIAEHLNPNGRAGIVVPNGIVATSQTAYKQLRRMLVEDSLIAVISLPAGCFNPYSGVKTSVLILDKALSKKTYNILFLKIENDGYDLGAQRREHDKNDLPLALLTLNGFKKSLKDGSKLKDLPELATFVDRKVILDHKDVVLSAERYFETKANQTVFDLVPLGKICKVINGRAYKQEELLDKGKYLILRVGNFFTNKSWYYSDLELPEDKYCDKGDLLYAWSASFGPRIWEGEKVIYHYHIWKMVPDESVILKKYLYLVLGKETERMKAENTNGSTMLHLTKEGIEQLEIPLPPLEIQQQIVAEIESYQKIIDGARQVVENYKPVIKIKPEWEMVELRKLMLLITKGSSPNWQGINYTDETKGILFITSENVGKATLLLDKKKYVEKRFNEIEKKSILKKGDILTNIVGASIGRTAIFNLDEVANINQAVCILRSNPELVNNFYLAAFFNTDYFVDKLLGGSENNARANVSMGTIGDMQIPLPPLIEQHEIIKQIEEEKALIYNNSKVIDLFEQKIKDKINEVWGVSEGLTQNNVSLNIVKESVGNY